MIVKEQLQEAKFSLIQRTQANPTEKPMHLPNFPYTELSTMNAAQINILCPEYADHSLNMTDARKVKKKLAPGMVRNEEQRREKPWKDLAQRSPGKNVE